MTAPVAIRRLNAADQDFARHLDHLLSWESVSDDAVNQRVLEIIQAVRQRGDAALVEYTQRFDGLEVASMADLILPRERLELALTRISAEQRQALEVAAERVRSYHEKQKQDSWRYSEADGTVLGQKVTPLDRAGLYVPGGKASYPSSVLMNAIPAKVAGVPEVVMVVPTPRGEINEIVLAAAAIAGVDRVFTIGGAQAVAALAYGTESVPPVDKIVGPGNIYCGHRQAPRVRQGGYRHDRRAVGDSGGLRRPDRSGLDRHGPVLPGRARRRRPVDPGQPGCRLPRPRRREHRQAAADHGACRDHPHLAGGAWRLDPGGRHGAGHRGGQSYRAGAPGAFSGRSGSLAAADSPRRCDLHGPLHSRGLGRLCGWPDHVLPTSGTARFSSPLGVYDFQKRSSIIFCSPEGASELGKSASVLARGESLTAHARSAEYRIKPSASPNL